MRIKKISYSINNIMEAVSGTIYWMAPLNRPRDLEVIMNKLVAGLENKSVNKFSNRYIYMDIEEFDKYLTATLMSIEEFRNLNKTYYDIINNTPEDQIPKYVFTSIHDEVTEESWKHDFIDLTACTRNILNRLYSCMEETDCFLCINEGTDSCRTCTLNSEMSNNYESENEPFGDDVMEWCTVGCSKGKAICCKDCKLIDTCDDICDDINIVNCSQLIKREDKYPSSLKLGDLGPSKELRDCNHQYCCYCTNDVEEILESNEIYEVSSDSEIKGSFVGYPDNNHETSEDCRNPISGFDPNDCCEED